MIELAFSIKVSRFSELELYLNSKLGMTDRKITLSKKQGLRELKHLQSAASCQLEFRHDLNWPALFTLIHVIPNLGCFV